MDNLPLSIEDITMSIYLFRNLVMKLKLKLFNFIPGFWIILLVQFSVCILKRIFTYSLQHYFTRRVTLKNYTKTAQQTAVFDTCYLRVKGNNRISCSWRHSVGVLVRSSQSVSRRPAAFMVTGGLCCVIVRVWVFLCFPCLLCGVYGKVFCWRSQT